MNDIRAARNEAMFRDANEAIAKGQWPGEPPHRVAFRCECAQIDCATTIAVMLAAYQQVRRDSRRFLLAPGHELPEVEDVVERHPGYVVVEKREPGAALAEELDPRA